MVPAGFKTAIRGAAENPCLIPQGHWERSYVRTGHIISLFFVKAKFLELAVTFRVFLMNNPSVH
jgi:hypothetical protein